MAQRVGQPTSEVDMDAVQYLNIIGMPMKDMLKECNLHVEIDGESDDGRKMVNR